MSKAWKILDLFGIGEKLKKEGYNKAELNSILKSLAIHDGTNDQLDNALEQWLAGEKIDDIEIEGVSIYQLIEERGFHPVNAINILYHMVEDPEEMKMILAEPIR